MVSVLLPSLPSSFSQPLPPTRYLAANAPAINAFKQAGVPVRGNQVFLGGAWMSPKAAAQAGLA